MQAEDRIYRDIRSQDPDAELSSFNIPRSSEFVINSRGQKLHVRTCWPEANSLDCEGSFNVNDLDASLDPSISNSVDATNSIPVSPKNLNCPQESDAVFQSPRAIILMLHGYAAHCSRPTYEFFAQRLNEQRLALVTMDFHGHGYSEGKRGFLTSVEDMLDDVESVVRAVYSDALESPTGNHVLRHIAEKETPLYVTGQSMGGAAAILMAHRFSQYALKAQSRASRGKMSDNSNDTPHDESRQEESVQPLAEGHVESDRKNRTPVAGTGAQVQRASSIGGFLSYCASYCIHSSHFSSPPDPLPFRGMVLLCPALIVAKPPAVVTALLNYLIVPLLPSVVIPDLSSAAASDATDHMIWRDDAYINYIHSDQYPSNPHGLSWGLNPRFRTASVILELCDRAKAVIPEINCPFVVYHDPSDAAVKIRGSDYLMNESKTEAGFKQFVPMPGGRHDLHSNCLEYITLHMRDWIVDDLDTISWASSTCTS